MTAAAPAMTSAELLARLRRHYLKPGPLPGGIFVDEVGSNDWNAAGRRCDAIYVGFTSTSGRHLVGHELKVSRADWRHELDSPGKADHWANQCHAWYVVAPSTDIVPVEELPAEWGLLVVNPRSRTRLDVARRAHVHADRTPSWQVVRSVMARYDTLRAQAIADGKLAAEAGVQAELREARQRKRLEARGLDETARLELALNLAQQRNRQAGLPSTYLTTEDLAGLLADTMAARAAANILRGQADQLAGSLREVRRQVDKVVAEPISQWLRGISALTEAAAEP